MIPSPESGQCSSTPAPTEAGEKCHGEHKRGAADPPSCPARPGQPCRGSLTAPGWTLTWGPGLELVEALMTCWHSFPPRAQRQAMWQFSPEAQAEALARWTVASPLAGLLYVHGSPHGAAAHGSPRPMALGLTMPIHPQGAGTAALHFASCQPSDALLPAARHFLAVAHQLFPSLTALMPVPWLRARAFVTALGFEAVATLAGSCPLARGRVVAGVLYVRHRED